LTFKQAQRRHLNQGPSRLILIGLPGSGKSAVGRLFACRNGSDWVDADAALEECFGMKVSEFFALRGEDAFRDAETQFLMAFLSASDEPAASHDRVLSTGGGVVMRQPNRELLRSCGYPVVYIRAEISAIERRLRHDTSRPLLHGDDKLARLQALYDSRDPLYMEVATHVIAPGSNWTIARCVDAVEAALSADESR
jgi:shikimate kinase